MGEYLPDFKSRSPSWLSVDTEDMHRGALTVPGFFSIPLWSISSSCTGSDSKSMCFYKDIEGRIVIFFKKKAKTKQNNKQQMTITKHISEFTYTEYCDLYAFTTLNDIPMRGL